MRVLHTWLQRYVPFTVPPAALADKLSMLGVEIEDVVDLGKRFEGFIVGKVIECVPHPNADRLSVCRVDIGKEILQIVCGAPNVSVGQKVAVGRVGATVPRNQHDPNGKPFVLSQVKIRGVESFGMICSAYELDIGNDADGILLLNKSTRIGQPVSVALGQNETLYDVEITANRPDLLSHIGVAREIGLVVGKKIARPLSRPRAGKTPISRFLSVRVLDKKNCLRFSARVIRGVKVGHSPDWLQKFLRNVGLRPRNNIVDVTNFVMYELGQPLHAFDHSLLQGKKLIIQQAKAGTHFQTLDGKDHELPPEAVMVCDAERPVSIAGIMGGENSEINEKTVDIVLESAYWNARNIRKTARMLGISSDASYRFERGTDPNGTVAALNRAASLILEIAGGELLHGTIDIYPRKVLPRKIPLRITRVNHVLGTRLPSSLVKKILKGLEIQVSAGKGGTFNCTIPTFRIDIEREIDLIEEVARIYGYDSIEEKGIASINLMQSFPTGHQSDPVRTSLVGAGFHETICNPMYDLARAKIVTREHIPIKNPQNKGMEVLRASLIPGLLDCVARNSNFGNRHVRLFEIGHIFEARQPLTDRQDLQSAVEEERVGIAITGRRSPRTWAEPERPVSLFDLKGELEALCVSLGLDKSKLIYYSTTESLTEQTLAIEINGTYAGYFGKAKTSLMALFDIEQEVYVGEMLISSLILSHERKYSPLPKYPAVQRDIAFVVSETVSADDLERCIRKSGTELLKKVELFDVYEGNELSGNQKSLAFTVTLLSGEKTLTDSEIEAEVRRITLGAERSLGATLRSS